MAVRVHVFDPFLFTKKFGVDQIEWKTHLISDFESAMMADGIWQRSDSVVPIHDNVIQNYANIELFDSGDENEEDCLGWITIMEKCERNLRTELKRENLNLNERKKIATGIKAGLDYLRKIGIEHKDRKMENFLLIGDVVKICDFGLVQERSGRNGFRKLGYTRRGSKYENDYALFSGTPGFAEHRQLRGIGVADIYFFSYLFCDWKTSWSLKYQPIDEINRKEIDRIVWNCGVQYLMGYDEDIDHVIKNIKKIISLPNASGLFCLDSNLTKSVNMLILKQQMTKCVNLTMQNLTKNILDQKWSNLCVPISVSALLRFAIKSDLDFDDEEDDFTIDRILTTLTMIVYPRSLAGLNLNPKKEEKDFQINDVETLLQRICKRTYLMESGWEIVRKRGDRKPAESTCEFKNATLNENFVFSRPLTVTGAFLLPDDTVFFHQMVLDRVDDLTDEYVIQNSSFEHGGAVLRIPKTREYYANEDVMLRHNTGPGEYKYYGRNGVFMWLVNEDFGNTMKQNTWYLLPQAYSITLTQLANSSDSDSSD